MSLETNNWARRFGNKGTSAFSAFMSTYNMVSQTYTQDTDPDTAGGGDCTINGVYIPALAASGAVTWLGGAAVSGNALGEVIPATYSVYLAIFADASGNLRVDLASAIALDGTCVLKIPWFDPSTWCCVGINLINGNGTTLGTDDLSGIDDPINVIGPVLPHPDNLKTG